MPDPIVHVTNGVPDAGTGNITTLGQTLLDGANIVLGATTDLAISAGAAGSVNAHLRSISRDIVGGIVLQPGASVIGAVTQSGGPWSVSGTVAATQSGTWNITNISGTVSLPTGASTAALQPTNAGQASTTSGQTGTMAMGAATTAAPTYSTGQTNPLSLTLTGALRTDSSATTQPISGSVSVTGTVAVTESGTWTVQPGNTANTTPWLMTINQGGHSATVSAAGALVIDGSGVTQPISAASLPLPSGASTAALQPTNAAQGSTTSGQTGPLVQGAVTTAAPSYTTAQTSPLSLTPAGSLRVDGSGVTQPVSGTITANQGGIWNIRLQDSGGGDMSDTTNHALKVNIVAGAGSGGTSSSVGGGMPTTGTLSMGSVTTAAPSYTTATANSLSLNTSGGLRVDGSGVTQPVSGTFWQATQPVSGTFWQATQPISAASLPLPSGAATSANQPSNAAIGSTTSGQTGGLAFGAVTTGLPSYTTAQSDPLSLTTTGLLRVDGSNVTQPVSLTSTTITGTVACTQSGTWNITNISGTVSLPTGAATSANQPTNAALGSTTTGQTGTIGLGAVTTAAPSYTTGQTNALSLTTTGGLRVDGSGVTQPVSGTITANQGGAWTVQPGNTANTTPWLFSINQGGNTASVTAASALKVDGSAVTQPVSGTVTANQGGNWTSRVVGNAGAIVDAAQNAAAPANEIVIGGVYNSAAPTITNGNATQLQTDVNGFLKVNVAAGGASGGTSSSFSATFPATGTAAGAEYLSSPPTLTSGQMVALQVTSAGSLHATVDNTPAVTQSGNWTSRIVGNAGVALDAAQNAAAPANELVVGGVYNSSAPTLTSGNASQFQLDASGNLNVNIKAGAGSGGTASNFNATFPTTGTAAGAEYLSSPPSYTSGQMVPLQVTSAGSLHTTVDTGSVSITGFTNLFSSSGAWTSATGVNTIFNMNTGSSFSTIVGEIAPSGSITGGAITFQESYDNGTNWVSIPVARLINPTTGAQLANPILLSGIALTPFEIVGSGAVQIRCALSTVITGTGSITVYANEVPVTAQVSVYQPNGANLHTVIDTGTNFIGNVFPYASATTSAPSYSNGTNNLLSLNLSGGLRVDGSGVTQPVSGTFWQATQPVSGTVTANQGGTWTVQPGNTANTTAWLVTGTGGTFPITAASLPLPSGAATAANQTNVQGVIGNATAPASMVVGGGVFNTTKPTLTNGQSAAFQSNASGILLTDGSSVTQPVSGTVTVQQATAANLNATVTGTVTANLGTIAGVSTAANQTNVQGVIGNATAPASMIVTGGVFNTTKPTLTTGQSAAIQVNSSGIQLVDGSSVTQPVSGTFWQATQPVSIAATVNVSAVQSGNWTSRIVGNAGVALDAAQNAAAPANELVVGGVYNSSAPTLTSGNASQLQLDTNGNLNVNIKAGAGSGGTSSSVGGTLPTTGTLAMGSVLVSGPTYTTGTAQPFWLDTSGYLHVTGPVSQSGTWTVTQSGNWTDRIVGNAGAILDFAGQNVASPANSLQIGGQFNTTPTTITSGNSSPLQLDSAGNLKVNTVDPAIYNAGTAWNNATALNTVAALIASTAVNYATIIGQITQTTTITGGQITFEESYDNGATYVTIPPQRFVDPTTYQPLANPYVCAASTNQRFHIIPSSTGMIRARLSTVIAGTGTVTVVWTLSQETAVDLTNTIAAGDTAAGATDQGWPIKIGGIAKTTNPTAWADGQRTAATFDKQGKLVAVGAIRQLKGVQKTSITTASETTVVTAGAAGVFNDVYAIVVTNKSNTSVFVDFKDATAGTTRMTLAAPANDTRGFTVAVDSAMVQAVAANNWTATVSSAVTSIEISMLYVSNL